MKYFYPALLGIMLTFYACSTKQYVTTSSAKRIDKSVDFVIIKNDFSLIIPAGRYPAHTIIQNFVVRSQPAISRIDSLIYFELKGKGFNAIIIAGQELQQKPGVNYIKYQDYWAWDFKKYMHVLKIFLYEGESKAAIMEAVSQGNKMGMHDYPNPKKQVPILVEKILNYQ